MAPDDEEVFESYETRIRNRLAAEEELDALDARRRERDYQTEMNLERINRFDQNELDAEDELDEEDVADGSERALNLEAFQCPLREWIAEERTRMEIQRRFQRFLLTYFSGIEEVSLWKKKNEHLDPPPKLPSYLKVLPPVYPPKIRSHIIIIIFIIIADILSYYVITIIDNLHCGIIIAIVRVIQDFIN